MIYHLYIDIQLEKSIFVNQSNQVNDQTPDEERVKLLNGIDYLNYNGATIPTGSNSFEDGIKNVFTLKSETTSTEFMGSSVTKKTFNPES